MLLGVVAQGSASCSRKNAATARKQNADDGEMTLPRSLVAALLP
jgi:hypothetical protein